MPVPMVHLLCCTICNRRSGTKPWQVRIVLGRMMLARGTAEIAISFLAGIRAVRVEGFWRTVILLGATISQKSAVPQITSLVP